MSMTGLSNRVKETSSTAGTGDFTLNGALPAYVAFSAAFQVGDVFSYFIASNTEWECGYGTLSGATTLVRDTVIASSNADALVNFAAGSKFVFCSPPASTIIEQNKALASMMCLALP